MTMVVWIAVRLVLSRFVLMFVVYLVLLLLNGLCLLSLRVCLCSGCAGCCVFA